MLNVEKVSDDYERLINTDGVTQPQVLYWTALMNGLTVTEVRDIVYGPPKMVPLVEIELYD